MTSLRQNDTKIMIYIWNNLFKEQSSECSTGFDAVGEFQLRFDQIVLKKAQNTIQFSFLKYIFKFT